MTADIDTIYRIFTRALQHEGEAERGAYIDRTCAGRPDLHAEVEALVRAHAEPHPALEELAHASALGGHALEDEKLGEFELLREIGAGGTGRVYLARQASLDRLVAIKAIERGPATSEEAMERFLREPRAVARLRHPNIVRILTDGIEGRTYWFAMELIEGHDLATEIRAQRAMSDPSVDAPVATLLPKFGSAAYIPAVARICARAADALRTAHAHDIIHRDIKPANLLLDLEADVHVVDFGLARDLNQEQRSLTAHGIAGTPAYMSPEQARTIQTPVDTRSDIYAMGVVLYELLTLQKPYQSDSWEELRTRIHAGNAPRVRKRNPAVPQDLETICSVAMSPEPHARYASAEDFANDLERFLRHQAIHARPPHFGQRLARNARRHARILALAAASLVLAALATLYFLEREAEQARTQSTARLEQLLQIEDWDDAPFTELATCLTDVRPSLGDSSPKPSVATAFDTRRAAYRHSLLQRGKESVWRATEGSEERSEDELETLRQNGMRLLYRAVALFPDDPEVRNSIPEAPHLPRVDIVAIDAASGDAVNARVRAHALDIATGMPERGIELGELPVRGARVSAGFVRFVLEVSTSKTHSFTRQVMRRSRENHFRLLVHERPTNTAPMVRIAGGRFTYPEDERGPPLAVRGRPVDIPPFWIDEREVNVGEYRRFLSATGHPPPPAWSTVSREAADTLPVTFVSWSSARAYAEWAGKRLPTFLEWSFVARGPEGRRFPWSDVDAFAHGNTRAKPREAPITMPERIRDYLVHARPGASDPLARPAAWPVFDLLGNVEEWTESLYVRDGSQRNLSARVIVAGSTWNAATLNRSLVAISNWSRDDESFARFRGFRCARDASP